MNAQAHLPIALVAPQADEQIEHYVLSPLLPDGHALALNPGLGTLSLLLRGEGGPRLVAQQQFTDSELCVLKPLLASYPYFCPYEVLLASFNSLHATDQEVARSRELLHEAQEAGVWDHEMRPVRNVLSRTRLKLNAMHIDIKSILETGYLLMPMRQREKPTKDTRL